MSGQSTWVGIVDEMGNATKDGIVERDSLDLFLESQLALWRSEGHIAASSDSLIWLAEDSARAYLYKGEKFSWADYTWKGEAEKYGLGRRPRPGDIVNPEVLRRDVKQVLTTLDANGFPFARISARSIIDTEGKVRIELTPNPGELILVDSIIVKTNSLKRRDLPQKILGLRPGRPYNGEVLKNGPLVLNGTGYLSVGRAPETLFTREGAVVFVYAEKKKASSANGILGFQPAADGSITFTGQADLVLRNALERGEQFEMHWRRLQAETQEFDLSVQWPYLFGTNLGITSNLELYRQDTTFANLIFRNGLTFPLNYRVQASAFVENRRSSALDDLATDSLSNLQSRLYGLGLSSQISDNPFNPTKGTFTSVTAAFGRKTITADDPDADDREVNQFVAELEAGIYLKFAQRFVYAPQVKAGVMEGEERYFNELFLFGGIQSIRGFDEGILRPSLYYHLNNEIRFLLDEDSHLLLLADLAYFKQQTIGSNFSDTPLGIGTGIRFATPGGQFQLIYALGKLAGEPFQFATGKVHFGFVSYF